ARVRPPPCGSRCATSATAIAWARWPWRAAPRPRATPCGELLAAEGGPALLGAGGEALVEVLRDEGHRRGEGLESGDVAEVPAHVGVHGALDRLHGQGRAGGDLVGEGAGRHLELGARDDLLHEADLE